MVEKIKFSHFEFIAVDWGPSLIFPPVPGSTSPMMTTSTGIMAPSGTGCGLGINTTEVGK